MAVNTLISNPVILKELNYINWQPILPVGNWISNAFIGKVGNLVFMKGSFSILSGSSGYEQIGIIPDNCKISAGTSVSMSGNMPGGSVGNFTVNIAGIYINSQNQLRIYNTLSPSSGYTISFDGLNYAL